MTVSLPLVVVLGLIAWGAVKFLGVRIWLVVVIALFGFYLADTFLAPAIDTGTRTGVEIVNGTPRLRGDTAMLFRPQLPPSTTDNHTTRP